MSNFARSSWQVQAYHMSFMQQYRDADDTSQPRAPSRRPQEVPATYDSRQGVGQTGTTSQSGFYDSDSELDTVNEKAGGRVSVREFASEAEETVLGSTELYENGQIRCIPMPTPDPRDPLNLPQWRKMTAIAVLCFFGSLGLAAEIAIGGLIPVFLLEYSDIDPVSVLSNSTLAGPAIATNPLAIFPEGTEAKVSLMQISLLATIPMIGNGIAGYLLIPLSTAIGRRPVLLITAVAAWAGGFWAGASNSLNSHIAARVFHGLGAGAVEALLPLIVQDLVFIHQRGRAIAAVIASQGVFIVLFSILGPYLSTHYSWRWIYWITSALGLVAWALIIAFVPESRWTRSKEELSGQKVYPLEPGENRPRLDPVTYGPRTLWTDIGIFHYGFEWKEAAISILDTVRTTFFPAIIYVVLINLGFYLINATVQQSISFSLLGAGIPFEWTGIAAVPSIFSTIAVYFLGGFVTDKISLFITKRNSGKREPEHILPSLSIAFVGIIIGCFVYGAASQNNLGVPVLLIGSFFVLTSALNALTTTNVFVVESYPQLAGPVLNTKSSLNIVTSFFLTSNATTWLEKIGPMRLFAIYAETMIVLAVTLPALYFFGKRLRLWTSGKVKDRSLPKKKTTTKLKRRDSDNSSLSV